MEGEPYPTEPQLPPPIGHFETIEALAEHLIVQFGVDQALEIGLAPFPTWLRSYLHFDKDRMIKDLLFNGDVKLADAPDGGVVAYWNL
jgi:hypothetical protein